jgi:small subunit ribosomal protein S9
LNNLFINYLVKLNKMSEIKKSTKTTKTSKISDKKEAKKEVKKEIKKVAEKKETLIKDSSKKIFSGKYIQAIGRRKTSVAQVRLYEKGSGEIVINNLKSLEYFKKEDNVSVALQPLKAVSKIKDFDISVVVKGGGILGQLDAIRHGIARGLIKIDPELKSILKTSGYITRDPRKKERKKPGLKKARKAPQWSKR